MAKCTSRLTLQAILGVLTAQAALAQTVATVQQRPNADIVVNGRRDFYQRELKDIRAITVRHDGQIARFQTEICPVVVGLPRSYAGAIEERIRTISHTVGLSVGGPKCVVDFTVIVADDPIATIAALRRTRHNLFETMTMGRTRSVGSG